MAKWPNYTCGFSVSICVCHTLFRHITASGLSFISLSHVFVLLWTVMSVESYYDEILKNIDLFQQGI